MSAAPSPRAVVVGALAALVLTGALTFWLLVILVALYGIGAAFFAPAFEALVPDIVPPDQLAAANELRALATGRAESFAFHAAAARRWTCVACARLPDHRGAHTPPEVSAGGERNESAVAEAR